MASSFFALLDDIATLLDDVSVLTKVAAQKTAGVLGDDLALNAKQVTGVAADRELPVVWAVARGSLLNKAILVPAALGISAIAPWAVLPLLMLGGAYLCLEGFEKLAHRFLHEPADEARRVQALERALAEPGADACAIERDKIKGAVRTDFILSAEIIVIALGTVADAPWPTRVAVLAAVALLMTVGVYGIVAAIVKLDDLGLWLQARGGAGAPVGRGLLWLAPRLMKLLSVAGTAAMFLVGGGILVHGLAPLEHAIEAMLHAVPDALDGIASLLGHALVGVLAGALVLAVVQVARRLRPARA